MTRQTASPARSPLTAPPAGCAEPAQDCPLCPRLAAFRADNRQRFPGKFNAPVPSFGPAGARLLIVGLAPGLKGANFSGRPFTGDYAGVLLYETLLKYGYAEGKYEARPDDGLRLTGCRITNAVRCVPPENKPTGDEVKTCQRFFAATLAEMKDLRVLLALGKIAHDTVVRSFGGKLSAYPFAHNAVHRLENGLILVNSYHCSRYNTQTGRLTEGMFHDVFDTIGNCLKERKSSS